MRIGTAIYHHETKTIWATIGAPGLLEFSVSIAKIENRSDRAPDWEIRYEGQRCGALWKRTVRDTGTEFLSGPLESPIFPGGKIEIAVWKAKEEDRKGQWDISWTPPREERQAPSQAAAPAGSGGAGEDGDEIPF